MDVSHYQGDVDWRSAYAKGARFVYIKATESTDNVSAPFSQQYAGAADAGMIRGAYHFAQPDASIGAVQADYFIDHGGAWKPDGKTLPGALDLEWNPVGPSGCYGMTQAQMQQWIKSFSDRYHIREGVWPVIYTSTTWWEQCVGNANFGNQDPLWIARYSDSAGDLPSGWKSDTIWQNSPEGPLPGDQDVFQGGMSQLHELACAGHC